MKYRLIHRPVDKVSGLGLRQLMAKSEIPKLLGLLKKSAATITNWKQRAIDNIRAQGKKLIGPKPVISEDTPARYFSQNRLIELERKFYGE